MTTSQTMFMGNLKVDVGSYFRAPLSDFYTIPTHRLMVYALIFILAGMGVFAGLAIYDYSNDLITIPLKFMGMNAWHTAANFAVCIILVDILSAFFVRPWGVYEQRTVGKAWIIFFAGYLLGFMMERAIAYKLIGLYEPKVIYLWEVAPSQRAGALPMFIFTLPFWFVIISVVMRILTSKQAQTVELLRARLETILKERACLGPCHPAQGTPKAANGSSGPEDYLQLPTDPGVGPIYPSDIGHVTAEDHYLRIFFRNGDKTQNTLIRMPLKALSARLPEDQFIRIHRSHLVNLDKISGLKRYPTAVRLSMKHGDIELPVSRHRLPRLLPVLERFLDN